MIIINKKTSISELIPLAERSFGDMLKAVVDIEKGIMAIDASLHADEEAALINSGPAQKDLWGINIYFDNKNNYRLEFESMINLRPGQGNRSRTVEDQNAREKISKIVGQLIEK